ncbi:conserved hypothetical protein [Paraburkholderia tropica]|uniref:hypothetical protein n=1 Tax=Paraburkholderia tropica TaxID=92647 RepID=UPI001CAD04E1|nr:hypothetical protein [Paraburkholderia tropica]CAG9226678.1 conserved hypothetical protein [Paraburkholderia tropica]
MKTVFLTTMIAAATLALGGCHSRDAANQANFSAALEQHFEAHGDLCIGRHSWPVDVPDVPAAGRLRDGIQMPALEHAGLVEHVDAEMKLHRRDGADETVKARRYDLTAKGKALFNAHPHTAARGADAAQPDLCYGHVRLAKVAGWDAPHKSEDDPAHLVTTVRYTYTLDPAPWARDAAVQGAFPVLARVVNGSGSLELKQMLVAGDDGWHPL